MKVYTIAMDIENVGVDCEVFTTAEARDAKLKEYVLAGFANDVGQDEADRIAKLYDANELYALGDKLGCLFGTYVTGEHELPDPAPDKPARPIFTVFCRQSDNTGPMWIDAVEADNAEDAMPEGQARCAADWRARLIDVIVVGVAEGDVKVLYWDDNL